MKNVIFLFAIACLVHSCWMPYREFNEDPTILTIKKGEHNANPILMDHAKEFNALDMFIEYDPSEMADSELGFDHWIILGGLNSDNLYVRLTFKIDSEDPNYFYPGYVVKGLNGDEVLSDYFYYKEIDGTPTDEKAHIKVNQVFSSSVIPSSYDMRFGVHYDNKDWWMKIEPENIQKRGFTPVFEMIYHETLTAPTDITCSGKFSDTNWNW
jgi:hypothetical protein